MASTDHFRHELLAQMDRATARGAKHILINVRELYSSLGDAPNPKDDLISCRLAMRMEMTIGDVLLVREANGAGMTVRYALPR